MDLSDVRDTLRACLKPHKTYSAIARPGSMSRKKKENDGEDDYGEKNASEYLGKRFSFRD